MALNNDNVSIRRGAAFCLGKLGDKRFTEYLVPLLDDYENRVRSWTIRALDQYEDIRLFDIFVAQAASPNEEVAIAAIKALGNLRGNKGVEPLIELLEDHNTNINIIHIVISTLGMLRDNRATDTLIKHLKSENVIVRRRAAEDLGNLNDEKAVNPLINVLNDSDWRVVRYSILSLGQLRDKRAIKKLEQLLKSDNEEIAISVSIALEKIQYD